MCLITKKQNVRTTKRDIIVWKLLRYSDGDYKAKYSNFTYVEDNLYKTNMKLVPKSERTSMFTRGGWRTLNARTAKLLTRNLGVWSRTGHEDRDKMICIGQGFHAYTKKKTAKLDMSKSEVLVKFIIPKGAKYYKDICDCIVADKIIMVGNEKK